MEGQVSISFLRDCMMHWTCMEPTPFSIKLADQRKVTPLGLAKNAFVRVSRIWFLFASMVMELPSQNSWFSILLGRPWLKAVVVMHDWKNNTLILQSQDKVVKVNLKDGKTRPMIPRGSKPSSSTSIASDETLIPSNLSSDFVMNWVEALTTIDCLTVDVLEPA